MDMWCAAVALVDGVCAAAACLPWCLPSARRGPPALCFLSGRELRALQRLLIQSCTLRPEALATLRAQVQLQGFFSNKKPPNLRRKRGACSTVTGHADSPGAGGAAGASQAGAGGP